MKDFKVTYLPPEGKGMPFGFTAGKYYDVYHIDYQAEMLLVADDEGKFQKLSFFRCRVEDLQKPVKEEQELSPQQKAALTRKRKAEGAK